LRIQFLAILVFFDGRESIARVETQTFATSKTVPVDLLVYWVAIRPIVESPKMLAYILAIALGIGSIGLFLSAFIAPKIHRQDDFLWTGLGLFYALVLWVCASRLTGGVLLGQTAAVLLLLSFGWQIVKLRGAVANPEKLAELAEFSVTRTIGNLFQGKPKVTIPSAEKVAGTVENAKETAAEVKEEVAEKVNGTVEEVVDKVEELTAKAKEVTKETVAEAVGEAKKKSGFLTGIFNKQKAGKPIDSKQEKKSTAKPIFDAEDEELQDLPVKQTETAEKATDRMPETSTEPVDRSEPKQEEEKVKEEILETTPEPPAEKTPEKSETKPEVVIAEVVKAGDTNLGNIKTEMKAVLETIADKGEKIADKIEESIEEKSSDSE
jgi:hypothetical protein